MAYDLTQPLPTARALTQELYGVRAKANPLPGEYDFNFHLQAEDGQEFVLKIMRPGQSDQLIDFQIAALRHVAQRDPSLTLPRVCAAKNGAYRQAVATTDGETRAVWMLSYVPGRLLAKTNPHSPELLRSLGCFLGRLDRALSDFDHPTAHRDLEWSLVHAAWIEPHLDMIEDPRRLNIVRRFLTQFQHEVEPAWPALRAQVIHGDANDYNVLVNDRRATSREVVSVIDFGDMIHSKIVCEPAVASAYALLDKDDPLAAMAQVTAGYHSELPLTEPEIAVLFPLACMRLCMSVVLSALRKRQRPDEPYLTISEEPAWAALERLTRVHPRFAHYALRRACNLPPVPQSAEVVRLLNQSAATIVPLIDPDPRTAPSIVFDLSAASLLLGADPAAATTDRLTLTLFDRMADAGVELGIGRYDEARLVYTSALFATGSHPTHERRTIHLGLDLFAKPGTPVYAPLAGRIHAIADNNAEQDYGPVVLLRHETAAGIPFYTLYGHLDRDALTRTTAGQSVLAGTQLGAIGAPPGNGNWPPHLHFQIITDLLDLDTDFPGVALASQREIWCGLSPDPNLIAGVPLDRFPPAAPAKRDTLELRRKVLGRNLSISYHEPLKIVRGWMQYLYDESGRAYLDVYNNVPHVGHSHPRVVAAAQAQLGLLNTNTRYLHDSIVHYAERLIEKLPEPLRVCYFLNSASEANELALRLARTHTGRRDLLVMEAAYHGHTTSLIDISPYKFNGPGGTGRQPWVQVVPLPDDYRGPYKRHDPQAGIQYARQVAESIDRMMADGRPLAAWICESLPSVGGQIVLPSGYLSNVYDAVRAAGGVCIADEVQVGFGRLGTHFWGFQTQGVVPDIVVLGKPIGNGYPLAAVVTTPEIAASFDNGMEFFSTFGGNPVACAVGLAVLEVIEEEQLRQRSLEIGNNLLARLRELMGRHPILGDVRGLGLFLGLELVRNRETLEPAADEASYLVNRLREHAILTGTDGPHHNVIKIRPPLPFNRDDADLFIATLDRILGEDYLQAEALGCMDNSWAL